MSGQRAVYNERYAKLISLTTENTRNAVARCRQLKPRVIFIKERHFAVHSANNRNVYRVQFYVENGQKLGKCECKAYELGKVCYHLVAGAAVNIYRKRLERGR